MDPGFGIRTIVFACSAAISLVRDGDATITEFKGPHNRQSQIGRGIRL